MLTVKYILQVMRLLYQTSDVSPESLLPPERRPDKKDDGEGIKLDYHTTPEGDVVLYRVSPDLEGRRDRRV